MPDESEVKLFFSYSHQDESLRDQLATHLALLERQHVISAWHDRKIGAGSEWKDAIDSNLEAADIILLLISADFLASDYCYAVEMQRAMQKHRDKSAVVIPVLLRPCDVTDAEFMQLQGLPRDLKPVTSSQNQDEAFTDIVLGIRAVAEDIRNNGIHAVADNLGISINRTPLFNVPVPRNPFFTGRGDILAQLHKALNAKHEIAITPSKKAKALSGLGGVGKTQTVAEYPHRYQAD